jgi:hypothetical protein
MVRGRLTSLAAIGAAVVALGLPAGASAQGGGPFPDDQQPIADEYGLPPLDHPAGRGGGAGGGNAPGSTGFAGGGGPLGGLRTPGSAGDGSDARDTSLKVGDVQRAEERSRDARARRLVQPLQLGTSPVSPLSPSTDARSGLDIVVLVVAGLVAGGLLCLAGWTSARRRRHGT